MEIESKKKVYLTPKLIVYGSVEAITQGSADGDFTDQAFPALTPKRDLSFS